MIWAQERPKGPTGQKRVAETEEKERVPPCGKEHTVQRMLCEKNRYLLNILSRSLDQ